MLWRDGQAFSVPPLASTWPDLSWPRRNQGEKPAPFTEGFVFGGAGFVKPLWVLAVTAMSRCAPLWGSDQDPECQQRKAAKSLRCSRATKDVKAFKGGKGKKTCSDTALVWLNGEPLGN